MIKGLESATDFSEFCAAIKLSKRVRHFLSIAGIRTVGQLEKRLKSGEHIWYIGEKSEQEIRDALKRFYEMEEPSKIERYGTRF